MPVRLREEVQEVLRRGDGELISCRNGGGGLLVCSGNLTMQKGEVWSVLGRNRHSFCVINSTICIECFDGQTSTELR